MIESVSPVLLVEGAHGLDVHLLLAVVEHLELLDARLHLLDGHARRRDRRRLDLLHLDRQRSHLQATSIQ